MGLVGMGTSRDVMQGRGMAGAQGWHANLHWGSRGWASWWEGGGVTGNGPHIAALPGAYAHIQHHILHLGRRSATAGPPTPGVAGRSCAAFFSLPYSICSDGCTRCCMSVVSA